MAYFSGNYYLNDSQMKTNAQYILNYLLNKGWSKNAICGMLGNMQRESTINPGIWQNLDKNNTSLGYGLVQWTPATKYTGWADAHGYKWDSMDGNLERILFEVENSIQWIPTTQYPMTFKEFTTSNESPSNLASIFLLNYERAGVSAESERRANADYWFNTLEGTYNFIPMLDDSALDTTLYWIHTSNGGYNKCIEIDTSTGSVLPNCVGYAWGRFHMISDMSNGIQDYSNVPTLSRGDAGNWFAYTSDGYERGQIPKLGAVACWGNDGAGHVAIVEEIDSNGDITISQSAFGGTRWWTAKVKKSNGYNLVDGTFQGFIYNPYVIPINPGESSSSRKKKKYNFILFNRKRRLRNG